MAKHDPPSGTERGRVADHLPDRVKAVEILAAQMLTLGDQFLLGIELMMMARDDNHLIWMMIQCDGCGEPWCAIHQEHYHSCPCIGFADALDAFHGDDEDAQERAAELTADNSTQPFDPPLIIRCATAPITCPNCDTEIVGFKLYTDSRDSEAI